MKLAVTIILITALAILGAECFLAHAEQVGQYQTLEGQWIDTPGELVESIPLPAFTRGHDAVTQWSQSHAYQVADVFELLARVTDESIKAGNPLTGQNLIDIAQLAMFPPATDEQKAAALDEAKALLIQRGVPEDDETITTLTATAMATREAIQPIKMEEPSLKEIR